MTFNFDQATAALTAQAASSDATTAAMAKAGLALLAGNKAYFVALGEQAITQIVTAYLAGNDQAVVTTFWTLDQQAAAMVTGSADVAQRQYDFKQRALTVARIAAELIATVLAAGVVL
jgi:hypothetical protein